LHKRRSAARRSAEHPNNAIKLEEALALVRGGMSVTDAAMLSGLARSTVYKYAKVRMPEFAKLRLPILGGLQLARGG